MLALSALNVLAQPVISNFSPVSGPIGTTVTIGGSGFNASPGANSVTFGGIPANVVTATTTSLTVTVPKGTTYKPLTVETGGLTATSQGMFDVTFPGGGSTLSPTAFVASGSGGSMGLVSGMADFNGDGKMDMFNVQGFSQGLFISINTTTGHTVSFSQQLAYNTPALQHGGAAAGDLDGDGKPDIIISNSGLSPTISVYRNTTSGATVSFAANQDFASNEDPDEIAVGDLDGDGKPDVAIADFSAKVISIFRNTSTPGNVNFAARVDISPGSTPFSVSIADIDGDGKADLVLGTSAGLGAMRNTSTTGNISFGSFVNGGNANWLVSARAGDLDGDGKPELVAADARGNTIVVVPNNSSPGTLTFGSARSIASSPSTNRVDIDDMDGDGKPDLVSSNINYVNVSVFRNVGTSGAIAFAPNVDYNIGNVSLATSAVADVDANGRPDIIGNGSVYLNMVGAAPATITSFTPIFGVTGTAVTITGTNFTTADKVTFGGVPAQSFTINSASQITAIVGGGATGSVTVDNPDATATALGTFYFYPPVVKSFYPTIGDSGTTVTIYGANFANITDVKFGNVSATSFTVDSLGGITATVGAARTGDVSVISPNGTSTLSGFTYRPPMITGFSPASGPVGSVVTITGKNFLSDTAVEVVRFGAVKARLVSSSPTAIKVRVPAGASYEPLSVTIGMGRTATAAGPFLVTFPSDDRTITTGSFHPAATLTTRTRPGDVAITDLDGNGLADLIVVDSAAQSMAMYFNFSSIGNVVYNQGSEINADAAPIHLLTQDMNGDGVPDLILLNDDHSTGGYYPSHVKVIPVIDYPQYIGFSDQTLLATPTGPVASVSPISMGMPCPISSSATVTPRPSPFIPIQLITAATM
jgi:hypothetical protein